MTSGPWVRRYSTSLIRKGLIKSSYEARHILPSMLITFRFSLLKKKTSFTHHQYVIAGKLCLKWTRKNFSRYFYFSTLTKSFEESKLPSSPAITNMVYNEASSIANFSCGPDRTPKSAMHCLNAYN